MAQRSNYFGKARRAQREKSENRNLDKREKGGKGKFFCFEDFAGAESTNASAGRQVI